MERFIRLDNWNDLSAYKDKQGNIIPEYLYFMFAIKGYYNQKEVDAYKSAGTRKQNPADYTRENFE